MITLDGVSLQYGGVHAVRDVSLEFATGSRVALIGPNGAGKSSLLSLIGGQSKTSDGQVKLGEIDVTGMSARRRANLGIARSFQITNLMPKLTVWAQAELAVHRPNRFGVITRSRRARDAQVVELLAQWGIDKSRWNERPSLLSYGQQRALELALAMARNPHVLLLDEPNVGMTGKENAELVERVKGLNRDTTVVLVAHDMDMVFGFAERVVVMQRGGVLADDTPEAVRASQAVADVYIGSAEW